MMLKPVHSNQLLCNLQRTTYHLNQLQPSATPTKAAADVGMIGTHRPTSLLRAPDSDATYVCGGVAAVLGDETSLLHVSVCTESDS